MQILRNPFRVTGIGGGIGQEIPYPSTDVASVHHLLAQCPAAARTPLVSPRSLAEEAGVGTLLVKDERQRMGLGSFKALGAAYVIADDAKQSAEPDRSIALRGKTYVTASAGNHGLSVAAGAGVFGANAVIYLSRTVPESFADRLRLKGAKVVRAGEDYEASMRAALDAADVQGWTLLSDSSWPGYHDLPHRLMAGYLALMDEAIDQMPGPPTHVLLQAGVGGLAASCAALARERWGEAPTIVVVEPQAAPALLESIRAGHAIVASGPVSSMGRLDCKEPSLIALKGLARDADMFVTISEEEAARALDPLAAAGLGTTTSGAAGIAALLAARSRQHELGLSQAARVLAIVTEGAEP